MIGVVDSWNAEQGWGILRTPDDWTVFCHFSVVQGTGYRELQPGQRVEFDYRTPGQDGCDASVNTYARSLD